MLQLGFNLWLDLKNLQLCRAVNLKYKKKVSSIKYRIENYVIIKPSLKLKKKNYMMTKSSAKAKIKLWKIRKYFIIRIKKF